mmetsp:Transcript_15349/g.22648  ORF Transcript_15349/g.22648 Transcript_15349/m.22648 type:complete len:140 (+) Transcript_15349:119-538(+)
MSYSCNDNQNYFVEDGRTTSRVLSAPGGQSSINLKWDSPAKNKSGRTPLGENQDRVSFIQRKKAKEEVTGKIGDESGTRNKGPKIQQHHTASDVLVDERLVSSNRFANGSNMNSGNVMTDRSSTRVVAPPGGASQIFFG